MHYNRYQWLAILAAIVLCCLCCHALFAADSLADQKQTEKLMTKLTERNVTPDVRIVVIAAKVYGWYATKQPDTIYIVDRGTKQNVKTALHELEHRRQDRAGEPYDERKAYAAENGP